MVCQRCRKHLLLPSLRLFRLQQRKHQLTSMRITAFTLFIYIAISASAYAQRRFVVINMETKVPVRNVVVKYGKDTQSCTIWDGSFMLDSLLTDTCTQPIVLSRSGFLTLTLTASELTDTIEMLPSFNALTEVIIYGKRKSGIGMTWTYDPKTDMSIKKNKEGSVRADISGAIESLLTYKRRKRYEETKKRMEEY